MLLNNFFTLDQWQMDKTSAHAVLRLQPEHPIFGGHFPGRPVVPGACLLQLVEELMARVTGKDGRLNKADHIKFVSMIDPRLNAMLTMALTWQENAAGELRVDAEASVGAVGYVDDFAEAAAQDSAERPTRGPAEALAGDPAEASASGTICFKFKGTFQSA
jgi:3-hydroxyacyl-[acyl-carrier-protein] dehydratase